MTAIFSTLLLSVPASGAAVGDSAVSSSAHRIPGELERAASVHCPAVERAIRFYARRLNEHRAQMGMPRAEVRGSTVGRCPRYLAHLLQRKARAWRLRAEAWVEKRTLRDYRFCDGCNAWRKAVDEVQRVFPGTASWLLSCSGAEGGHGRWVGYSGVAYSTWLRDSDTVGGPLQFRFSTFTGMYRHGLEYLRARDFRAPSMDSTTAWRSALGQAIAGGWARYTGNDDSHWSASWGRGC